MSGAEHEDFRNEGMCMYGKCSFHNDDDTYFKRPQSFKGMNSKATQVIRNITWVGAVYAL